MIRSQLNCQLDAMNRRRKAGNEKTPPSARKYFIEFPPHRALTWRITLALDVGRVLEQRQHSFFSIFRESVQVKQLVVRRRGIDFEVSGMKNHSQRRVDGQ